MKKFKKRQILSVVGHWNGFYLSRGTNYYLKSESSRIKFTKALTAISGIATQTFQTIQKVPRNWKLPKLPKLFVKKKKPSIFSFTISADDAKKVADTGYTIFEYLYRRRQKNRSTYYFFRPDIKKIIKFPDSGP
jgi:hypothetical protein